MGQKRHFMTLASCSAHGFTYPSNKQSNAYQSNTFHLIMSGRIVYGHSQGFGVLLKAAVLLD